MAFKLLADLACYFYKFIQIAKINLNLLSL